MLLLMCTVDADEAIGFELRLGKLVTEFIRYFLVDERGYQKSVRETRGMGPTNALRFVWSARSDVMVSFRLSFFWLSSWTVSLRWVISASNRHEFQ